MITELEARAYRNSFKQPEHPYSWGRMLGPLLVWAAFLVIIVAGALSDQNALREVAVNIPPVQQVE